MSIQNVQEYELPPRMVAYTRVFSFSTVLGMGVASEEYMTRGGFPILAGGRVYMTQEVEYGGVKCSSRRGRPQEAARRDKREGWKLEGVGQETGGGEMIDAHGSDFT